METCRTQQIVGGNETLLTFVRNEAHFIWIHADSSGRIRDANVFCRQLVGRSLGGESLRNLFAICDDSTLNDLLRPGFGPRMLSISTASRTPASFNFSCRHSGTEDGSVYIFGEPDSEEIRNLGDSLAQINGELFNATRELRLKNRELAAANRALSEMEKLREDIDRITRHDLKTPLVGILSLSEYLLSTDVLDPAETIHFLEMIRQSANNMQEMILRSFSLYQMEKGAYPYTPSLFDLLAVFRRIVGDLTPLRKGDAVQIEILWEDSRRISPKGTETVPVFGEGILCYMMFANLVRNAVEASPKNETVRIMIRSLPANGTEVAIINKGVVPESIRERFFEKYATAEKPGGTGLGTYSAMHIAETHSGTIKMTTGEADETRITVRLPGAPVAQEKA
jgi:signal transduction histidine kinase